MKHFFILGRNPDLSRAEIFSYLEARKINFEELVFDSNFLILEIRENMEFDIQKFGGIVEYGKITFNGTKKALAEYIAKEEIIPADKFSYNVIGNFETERNLNLEQDLYKKFKSEKRKAMVRHGYGQIKIQDGEIFQIPNAEFHIFCYQQLKEIYFGLVTKEYSYKDIKERDMNKPVRRESLAISPRLAKILINLTQVKGDQLILDPFCGVGGILQEALVQGLNVYGVDRDPLAIQSAKKNLDWLKSKYPLSGKYELMAIDARKSPNLGFDGVATEPNLGETFRRKPNNFEARQLIEEFEIQITPLLQRIRLVKKPSSKIAITFPYVKNTMVDVEAICRMTGLRVYNPKGIQFPIKETRPGQFVSREFWVFI